MKSINKVITTSLAVAFFCNYGSADDEDFNVIDSFTSASYVRSLEVSPSRAYKTYAVIRWKDYFSKLKVLDYKVKWGIQENVFLDSIDLVPKLAPAGEEYKGTQQVTTDTIKLLTENTKYYAQFYRDYNTRVDITNFYFTTPPLQRVNPLTGEPVKTVIQPPLVSGKLTNINNIEVYTASGKRVAKAAYTSKKSVGVLSSSIKIPGLYIVYYKDRKGRAVASEKFLINR